MVSEDTRRFCKSATHEIAGEGKSRFDASLRTAFLFELPDVSVNTFETIFLGGALGGPSRSLALPRLVSAL
jgi:hypothetical protein